jgi:hypothetical protein
MRGGVSETILFLMYPIRCSGEIPGGIESHLNSILRCGGGTSRKYIGAFLTDTLSSLSDRPEERRNDAAAEGFTRSTCDEAPFYVSIISSLASNSYPQAVQWMQSNSTTRSSN